MPKNNVCPKCGNTGVVTGFADNLLPTVSLNCPEIPLNPKIKIQSCTCPYGEMRHERSNPKYVNPLEYLTNDELAGILFASIFEQKIGDN